MVNKTKKTNYQICTRCVMDTSDENIVFDNDGVCNRCHEYEDRILPEWNHGCGHEQELSNLISKIKQSGIGKEYDCILGLSGGLDSSYMLHMAVTEWGLRPFVFHIDAGWDLPVARENIKKLTDKLGVHLHVEQMDSVEMKEMQLAWFRTGLENLDSPQDHAFIALVDKFARELKVKYILNGYNISTEVVADPASWTNDGGPTGDKKFMKDVIKKYCTIPIKKYTFTSGLKHKVLIPYVYGIKTIKPLNLVPVTRQQMLDVLAEKYGYEPYGQKHFEDLLTKFLEGWWMPSKYGHDIRRAQLSSLVVTGQMTREEALTILEQPSLTEEESKKLFSLVASKLDITEDELLRLYKLDRCEEKFKNNEWVYKIGIRLFEIIGIEKRIRR